MKAIPALISFDQSVISSETSGYQQLIESLLNLLQDTQQTVAVLAWCVSITSYLDYMTTN